MATVAAMPDTETQPVRLAQSFLRLQNTKLKPRAQMRSSLRLLHSTTLSFRRVR